MLGGDQAKGYTTQLDKKAHNTVGLGKTQCAQNVNAADLIANVLMPHNTSQYTGAIKVLLHLPPFGSNNQGFIYVVTQLQLQ